MIDSGHNILMLNFSDRVGGASRAAYRLHHGLREIGVNSKLLVQNKEGDDDTVMGPPSKVLKGFSKLRYHLDSLPLHLYRKRDNSPFSLSWLPNAIKSQTNPLVADLVHLHWVCGGFIPIEQIAAIKQPLLWTLHDCWAFTGGCHYPFDCVRYKEACGACPHLGSTSENDLSRWVWNRKAKHWGLHKLTIITPSRWLAGCARSSSLFRQARIEVIPYGLDLQRYKPIDRGLARKWLGLPQDKKIIMCADMGISSDRRKGFHYLQLALKILAADGWQEKAKVIIFGSGPFTNPPATYLPTEFLGRLHDDISLSLLYAAGDVLVAPSIQDNLPNAVMEALACGTPVVAFDIGGMPDLISHQQNGYLAKPFYTVDLARGIDWVLSDDDRHISLCRAARAKAEQEYEISKIAHRYLSCYRKILNTNMFSSSEKIA